MMNDLLRFFFAKRHASMRFFTALPALVAFLFIGHAFEDAGIIGATPYLAIIVLSALYVFRPMMICWIPLFVAFAAYAVLVALYFQGAPFSERYIFILFGLVPAVFLWFARPHKQQKYPGITTGCTQTRRKRRAGKPER